MKSTRPNARLKKVRAFVAAIAAAYPAADAHILISGNVTDDRFTTKYGPVEDFDRILSCPGDEFLGVGSVTMRGHSGYEIQLYPFPTKKCSERNCLKVLATVMHAGVGEAHAAVETMNRTVSAGMVN